MAIQSSETIAEGGQLADGFAVTPKAVYPGIWCVRLGYPEAIVPSRFRSADPAEPKGLAEVSACPLDVTQWLARRSAQGFTVMIPASDEAYYGLGLQLKSLNQKAKKRVLRVNSDPPADTGDSHAPVPLLISPRGWGLLFDTARYVQFYVGSHHAPGDITASDHGITPVATETDALYGRSSGAGSPIQAHVPHCQGVDVYIIAGPTLRDVVCRYNLFSGGGCLPSLRGLGVWYRAFAQWDQEQVLSIAHRLRDSQMPCDVLGLEPGWQSHAYPCTFAWDSHRFPQPDQMIRQLAEQGFEVNLWEHAFVHPDSPMRPRIGDRVGQWAVFNGAVPDLLDPDVQQVFTDHHQHQFAEQGISGFKLDECDSSDFVKRPWSFPEHDQFPSGADGEQMHSLFGLAYQRAIGDAFEAVDRRTYGEVRSSHAFAAPQPFVLYSDLYDHRDFVRGMCTSGFSGLLWCPEVRHARSSEELVRRLQTVILSPQALINAWYIDGTPWDMDYTQADVQPARRRGRTDESGCSPGVEQTRGICRRVLQLRMRLVPYLYSAFADYLRQGLPPVRALVMDWPNDPQVRELDDQWMFGPDLLAVPIFTGQQTRRFYLPEGRWHDIFTGRVYAGGQFHEREVRLDEMLIFAADGTLLPIAQDLPHITDQTVFDVQVHRFGSPSRTCRLWEDDGCTFDYRRGVFNELHVALSEEGVLKVLRLGKYAGSRHRVGLATSPSVRW